jgi:hypothetical protein
VETLYWEQLPWPALLAASGLSLGILKLLHLLLSLLCHLVVPFFFIALVLSSELSLLNHSSPVCPASSQACELRGALVSKVIYNFNFHNFSVQTVCHTFGLTLSICPTGIMKDNFYYHLYHAT